MSVDSVAKNMGIYLTDTFNFTPELAVTASGRHLVQVGFNRRYDAAYADSEALASDLEMSPRGPLAAGRSPGSPG